jgi:hypothetical protein
MPYDLRRAATVTAGALVAEIEPTAVGRTGHPGTYRGDHGADSKQQHRNARSPWLARQSHCPRAFSSSPPVTPVSIFCFTRQFPCGAHTPVRSSEQYLQVRVNPGSPLSRKQT